MSLKVDIRKKLGDFNLDVCFETDNETSALLGASGSGKSMSLKCIAGIEKPDSGYIILNGRTLFDGDRGINLSPQQRRVGYLFQQYALFPNMTVEQNIAAGVRSSDKKVKKCAVEEKIHSFRLEGLEKKHPWQLSGGQQQRVALARILVNEPEVLLLDEPFSALDSTLRWQLELELSELLEQFPGDVLYVSHNRDEVFRLCKTVCVIEEGKSQSKVTVKELFQSPGTVSAARLSGCKNILPIKKAGENRVLIEDWGITLITGDRVDCGITHAGIRAHHILAGCDGENVIGCRVVKTIDNVFSTIVMLEPIEGKHNSSVIRMEMDKERWNAMNCQGQLKVHMPPDKIMLLSGGCKEWRI